MKVKSGNPRARAIESLQRLKGRLEPKHVTHRAIVGDGAGHVDVDGYPGLFWIRLLGETEMLAQCKREGLVPAQGMHILVEETGERGQRQYRYVGRPDTQGWFVGDTREIPVGSPLEAHHWTHEVGGSDLVNVGLRMMEDLRATPTVPASLYLYVSPGIAVVSDTVLQWTGGNSPVFTAPSFGIRYDLLSLDSDNTLHVTEGEAAWLNPEKPTCPEGELPIAYVLFQYGWTEITEAEIYDARPLFTSVCAAVRLYEDPGVHVFNEDFSAQCNGTKTQFHTNLGYRERMLQLFHNGNLLRYGAWADFVEDVSRTSFTLQTSAPVAGDSLIAHYLAEVI